MKALGKHIILELYGCDREILNDREKVGDFIIESVRISGATLLHPYFHQFSPQGVSGVAVIAESHFTIHTWPEYGYAALDIFTCGDDIDSDVAVSYLRKQFNAESIQVVELKRGALDVPSECLKHKQGAEDTSDLTLLQGGATR